MDHVRLEDVLHRYDWSALNKYVAGDISAIVKRLRQSSGVPALTAAIVAADECGEPAIIQSVAEGLANVSHRWAIGSCAKSMSATLFARLDRDGVLRFGETVRDIIGTADTSATIHADWSYVTVAQLLSHQSGVRDEQITREHRQANADKTAIQHRCDYVKSVVARPLPMPPGQSYAYSNDGFVIVAALAEIRTQREWTDLMREYVFDPLNMLTAGCGVTPDMSGHIANSRGEYIAADADTDSMRIPAGQVYMNISDWCAYISLHLSAMIPNSMLPFLDDKTFARLHTDTLAAPAASYTIGGWKRLDSPTQLNGITHWGFGQRSFVSRCLIVRPLRFAIVVCTNCDNQNIVDQTVLQILLQMRDTTIKEIK